MHLLDKAHAWPKIPGLDDGGIACLFQAPGDPFGPSAVGFVVANEKVFWGVLVHPTTLSLFFLHCHEEVAGTVEPILA